VRGEREGLLVFANLGKVVNELSVKPVFCTSAKCFLRRTAISADTPDFAVDEVVEGLGA
jgi:hypothetical protein